MTVKSLSPKDLLRSIKLLKNTAPDEFALWMQMFEMYVDQAITATVTAPSESVLKAQGMALALVALRQAFRECDNFTERSDAQ